MDKHSACLTAFGFPADVLDTAMIFREFDGLMVGPDLSGLCRTCSRAWGQDVGIEIAVFSAAGLAALANVCSSHGASLVRGRFVVKMGPDLDQDLDLMGLVVSTNKLIDPLEVYLLVPRAADEHRLVRQADDDLRIVMSR
jgi:hypothetical protein